MARYATDRETLEKESEVEFVKAGGPGGQHRNKRETGVRIHHPPSGVIVTATERRSQALNLDEAFERLAAKLRVLNRVPKKRKPTKPTKAAKEKRVAEKRQRSSTKKLRKTPAKEDE